MAFWEAGRKQLANTPVKLEKVEKYSKGTYNTYYVTVNTLNNETLTGYLSVPKAKGKYPVYITVPGAGPGAVGPTIWAGKGAITLAMNVHKFPTADNATEQKARYAASQKISYYPHRGAGDRSKYFFYSTYVGIDRVINHIAAMPEWDGKYMVIDGSSQGGGSALILSGLNKNITALAANVPALCDHGGAKSGRSSGWPRLDRQKNADAFAPYFDAANFARLVKVPALVSCGFIDTTCSPASVYAAYNQLKGSKQMVHVPLEGHTVSKIYAKTRDAFVAKHLGLTK
jgi:cephalosporin-C deacetylase-like acetyl esterase